MTKTVLTAVAVFLFAAGAVRAEDENTEPAVSWNAAAVPAKFTPQQPLPMAGYAGRNEPAEGTGNSTESVSVRSTASNCASFRTRRR